MIYVLTTGEKWGGGAQWPWWTVPQLNGKPPERGSSTVLWAIQGSTTHAQCRGNTQAIDCVFRQSASGSGYLTLTAMVHFVPAEFSPRPYCGLSATLLAWVLLVLLVHCSAIQDSHEGWGCIHPPQRDGGWYRKGAQLTGLFVHTYWPLGISPSGISCRCLSITEVRPSQSPLGPMKALHSPHIQGSLPHSYAFCTKSVEVVIATGLRNTSNEQRRQRFNAKALGKLTF